MTTVLLSSGNGSSNLGDEAMWEAAAYVTRDLLPGAPITTDAAAGWVSQFPDVTALPFLALALRRGVRVLKSDVRAPLPLTERLLSRPRRDEYARRVAEQFRACGASPQDLPQLAKDWIGAIDQCGSLVIAGAGALNDHYGAHGLASWSLLSGWAEDRAVPFAMIGQGIGPLRSAASQATAQRILRRAALVTVRDEGSAVVARELGASNVHVTHDWAILCAPETTDREFAKRFVSEVMGTDPFVVFSCHFAGHDTRRSRRNVSDALRVVVEDCRRARVRVLMLPNMTHGWRSDDRVTARQLVGSWPQTIQDHVSIADRRLSARQTRAVLALSRGLITTRYHPAVFAMAEGRGVLGLAYNEYYRQKLSGAAHLFGLDPNSTVKSLYGTNEAGRIIGNTALADLAELAPRELTVKDLDSITAPYTQFIRSLSSS